MKHFKREPGACGQRTCCGFGQEEGTEEEWCPCMMEAELVHLESGAREWGKNQGQQVWTPHWRSSTMEGIRDERRQ